MVPRLDFGHARARRFHDAGTFMSQAMRKERILAPLALHFKKLGVANAAGAQTHKRLPGAGAGDIQGLDDQRGVELV